MNNDLHNVDDIFSSAQQRFEEEPSANVWKKINADLDKKDAESYRRRFVGWKRVAIILILLLSGFVLYESGIIIKRSGGRNNNETVNSGLTSKDTVQNDNVFDIPKRQNENDINNRAGISPDKKTLNEKNNIGKEFSQQNIFSGKDDKENNITVNEEIPPQNQYLITDNIIHKSKLASNSKSPVSRYSKKGVKERDYEVYRTTKNNAQHPADKQNRLPAATGNNLVNNVADSETPLIKKNKITTVEKMPAFKIISLSMLIEKNISLNIPDSVLSKSLAIKPTTNAKIKFKPYWSVTGFASNDRARYKLNNDIQDNNGNPQDEKEEIGKRENHESSFSSGFLATRQFAKNWGLKTGLIYSNTAIAINPQEMYAAKKTDGTVAYKYITSSGYGYVKPGFGLPPAVGDSLQSAEAQHNLQSLSVPLQLTYRFDKKKISVIPSAGITANFITHATVKTEVKDALNKEAVTINGLNGMRKFYAGFIADVSLQYNYNNRWAFNLLPTFKYAMAPITKSNVVKTFPYSYGLGAGLTYKF